MGEGRKKSWREIDQMRDGSSHRKRGSKRGRSDLEQALDDPRIKSMYLKEAEKLFKGAKGRPAHSKELRAVHDAYGTTKFSTAVKEYMDTYGLPEDWATLLLLLDLKDEPRIVCDAIKGACELAGEKGLVERKGLRSKLQLLAMTARDPEVMETAEAYLPDLA